MFSVCDANNVRCGTCRYSFGMCFAGFQQVILNRSAGPDVITKFLQRFDLDLIARAHQVSLLKYTTSSRLIPGKGRGGWLRVLRQETVRDYLRCAKLLWNVRFVSIDVQRGRPDFQSVRPLDNAAAIMTVDENLLCSFQILKGSTTDLKFPRFQNNLSGSK